MRNETVARMGGRDVVVMDTISKIGAKDEGAIVVCGSHGGRISAAFAAAHPPALVFFNDAGIGKNEAGVAALAALEAHGVAAAAVSHRSARIGEAMDAWENGIVSRRNRQAEAAGIAATQSVKEAAAHFLLPEGEGGGEADG